MIGRPGPNQNVLINGPFDRSYKKLFQALVFVVHQCGFIPRCALEPGDGAEARFRKISQIIAECGYGVHDISYAKTDPRTRLARFNMPLELGLFLGCGIFTRRQDPANKCLILDSDKFRYRKFISSQIFPVRISMLTPGARSNSYPDNRSLSKVPKRLSHDLWATGDLTRSPYVRRFFGD